VPQTTKAITTDFLIFEDPYSVDNVLGIPDIPRYGKLIVTKDSVYFEG
jgi:hypothetical protein